jgi:SAM-dependent methyltransferase
MQRPSVVEGQSFSRESDIGGYSRVDSTVEFYLRIRALCLELETSRPLVILDYGAGRGNFTEDRVKIRRFLRDLRDLGEVIGADVDPAIMENSSIDRGLIIVDGCIPMDDLSVDVVISDFTFEHIARPAEVSAEISRVLRPGGWICVRTPNRWGLVGVATRLVPNRLHILALKRLQPFKKEIDTFPTSYLLNSYRQLARWFPPESFNSVVYSFETDAAYAAGSRLFHSVLSFVSFFTPPRMGSVLIAFMQKKPA